MRLSIALFTHCLSLDDHPWMDKSEDVRIFGSCNGLIGIGVGFEELYLWNPAMKKSKKLPSLGIEFNGTHFSVFGLGYEEGDGDYKVVGIHGHVDDHVNPEKEVRIYSSKNNSWKIFKNVTIPNGIGSTFGGVFVNGKFHFQLTDFQHPSGAQMNHIAVLDLSDNKVICRNLAPPMAEEYVSFWTLCEVNGSLYVLCDNINNNQNDVWILGDDNVGI